MKNEKLKQSVQFDDQGNILTTKPFCVALQERIIHVCYSINRHRSCPVILAAFLLLISYFQIFGQLLDKHFIPRDDADWGPCMFMGNIFDLSRISPLLLESPGNEAWVFIYFSIICLVLYIAAIYFMHYSIQIKKLYFVLPIELCSFFSAVLLWILIGPICEVYISIFYCTYDIEQPSVLLLPKTKCWAGTHVIMATVLGLCMAFYIVLSIGVALYFNASNPSFLSSREDGLSRLDTNTELYYCLFRIITAILFRWLLDRKLEWVFLLIHLIYAIIFAYRYYKNVPYYNPFISALYGGCVLTHLWQVANVFCFTVLGEEGKKDLYKGVAAVCVIGSAVAYIFAKHLRRKLINQKVIDLHHAKITSEEELDVYIQSLLQLHEAQQGSMDEELLLRGVVWRHKAECIDPECPLLKRGVNKLFYPLMEEEIVTEPDNIKERIVILTLLNSILKERGKRAGEQASACFHLIYSNFLFQELGNAHMAIVEVMRANKSSPTTQQRMSIYALLRSIEEYLIVKHRKQKGKGEMMTTNLQGAAEIWDVTIVIKFENLLLQFIKYIEQCAGDHIEFWSHLDSMLPDLNDVNKIGLRILETSKDIQRIWSKLNKINPNHPKALNIYGYYLREISNDSELGQEFIDKAITINLHKSVADDPLNDFELMFAEDTAIIMMNGSPDQLGKIIKTNSGVLKLFGYNQFEIYGNDVSIIMPGIFARHHAKFMQRYFETGKQFLIQTERVLYALHRNNYLFCISIVVKPVPSLASALPQYIALIRQINKDFDYIITDENGKIDSISMGIYHMYNLSSSFIKENHIYIQLICPELADPVSFVDDKVKLRFCTFTGRRKLGFTIPRDFTTLAHLFSQTAKDPMDTPGINSGQQITEAKYPYNYSEAPYFFNLIYKIYKGKYPSTTFDIGRKNIVKTCFDYSKCDIKTQATCEMIDAYYSEDTLHVKVFKVYRPKVIKKSSIDEYTERGHTSHAPRFPSHKDEAINKRGLGQVDLIEASLIKRSHTGVRGEAKLPSPLSSEEGKSEVKSPTSAVRVPDSHHESSEIVSASFNNSLKKHAEKGIVKKKTGIEPTDSGWFTLHNISSTDQNSLSMPISVPKEPQGNASPAEPQRLFVIKTIDIRQNEVAKKVLFRQNTLRSQMESEETPEVKKEEKKENGENEGSSPNKKEESSQGEPLHRGLSMKSTKKDIEDIGSVASSAGNVMRFIRSLRAALHEEYDPPSINQLKRLALVVLLTLLVLTILCYFLSQNIFGKLRRDTDFIIKVRERSSAILGVGQSVRFLVLLNGSEVRLDSALMDYNNSTGTGIKYKFENTTMAFTEWVPTTLENYVSILKSSEDFVSDILRDDASDRLNPGSIRIKDTFGTTTTLSCANAINGLISHALKIKKWWDPAKLTWERPVDDSISYVLHNSYNSISGKLVNALDAILENSKGDIGKNKNQFLIFLLIASGALLVSISIVLPVVVKARKNKQELLGLFFEIPARKISTQLEKCNQFCRMIHGENEVERPEIEDDDINNRMNKDNKANDDTDILLDGANNENDEEDSALPVSNSRVTQSKKKKKFKGYSANILYLLLESVLTLSILQSFFIYQTIRSVQFTNAVNHLMAELGETAQRMYSNDLYLAICLEFISTNGTSSVMNSLTETYIDTYVQRIMREQESFLQTHSDNNEYNTDSYKEVFDAMIYSDICTLIFPDFQSEDIGECQRYMSGILQKGLSSANVAFWDALKDVAKDFKRTYPRSLELQTLMVNDRRIHENHWLLFEYFSKAYELLQSELKESMEGIFSFQETLMLALFLVYIFILLVIYMVFVKVFIETTRNSLWVTKSMLTILPAEIILQVPKIRRFLISTTRSVIYGIKTDQSRSLLISLLTIQTLSIYCALLFYSTTYIIRVRTRQDGDFQGIWPKDIELPPQLHIEPPSQTHSKLLLLSFSSYLLLHTVEALH
eukprot:TRINITY_DN248_c0_g1_i1.p1 TRINITY_DN248_c0_g1~~TRINITY_DN248_c0_g1_i1.p1  ORF type:complete len:1944 (-),score=172.22 TRINITY_DN248_c0_g1_i1:9089-14920(-)